MLAGAGDARPRRCGPARCASRSRGGHQLRRRDGAHGPVPGRAQAAVRGRLRGRRDGPRVGGGRGRPRATASAWSPARSSAATPSRSSVTAADVVPLPDELSFEQGAAIPVNYATAWAGLIGYGSLQPGERVLDPLRRRAAWGSRRRRSPSAAARRSTARPRPASTTRSASSASTTRSTTRSSGWERGLPKFDVILDAVGGKSFRTQLRPAAPRRAARRLRRLRASCRGEQRNLRHGAAHGAAACRAST